MRFATKSVKKLWPIAPLLAGLIVGCATSPQPESSEPVSRDQAFATRNQGYSLLYGLMSDEKDVSKLLLIKREKSDVGELIREIARTSGEAAKQLENYEKADPHLHLKMTGLPKAEEQTRALISKTTAKELLSKGGEKFEVRILLTQNEALRYGSHLALVIQTMETEPERKKFLGETSQKLAALHQRVIDLFHARWNEPTTK